MPKRIKVLCMWVLEVEIPTAEENPDYDAEFDIEENHCPATGRVGVALEEIFHKSDEAGVCPMCPGGTNIILTEEQYAALVNMKTQSAVRKLLFP